MSILCTGSIPGANTAGFCYNMPQRLHPLNAEEMRIIRCAKNLRARLMTTADSECNKKSGYNAVLSERRKNAHPSFKRAGMRLKRL